MRKPLKRGFRGSALTVARKAIGKQTARSLKSKRSPERMRKALVQGLYLPLEVVKDSLQGLRSL
jgi:hypothetical protein